MSPRPSVSLKYYNLTIYAMQVVSWKLRRAEDNCLPRGTFFQLEGVLTSVAILPIIEKWELDTLTGVISYI